MQHRRVTLPFRRFVLGIALACGAVVANPAAAHQRPIGVDEWGPFLPGTVPCLRALSRVGRTCFDAVLDIHDACADAKMRGELCDAEATEELVAAETAKIRAAVLQSCQPGQLTELQYVGGVLDAQADHSNSCRGQAAATMAMTYAPQTNAKQVGGVSGEIAACVTATSGYSRKVLSFIVRRKALVMERIGIRILSGPRKIALMQRIGRSLAASEPRWAAGLLRACPAFEEIYGRTAVSFVRTLKDRADCVLTATHGNNALICVPPVCPNGVPETGEECDDGNDDDTDACGNDCKVN